MRFQLRHMRFIAVIAAVLLALSNSGFTAVLHSCLMVDRSCCDRPMNMMTHMPWEDAGSSDMPVLQSNMACCAITVAGGLNANPIVTVSLQSTFVHLDLIALLPPGISFGAEHIPAFSFLSPSTGAASPPSVETYILNASFLI